MSRGQCGLPRGQSPDPHMQRALLYRGLNSECARILALLQEAETQCSKRGQEPPHVETLVLEELRTPHPGPGQVLGAVGRPESSEYLIRSEDGSLVHWEGQLSPRPAPNSRP